MKKTLFIKRAALLASLAGLIAFAAAPLQAADRVTQGLWENTVTSAGKTRTFTICMTPDMAENANADEKTVRALAEKAGAGVCVIGTYQDSGNKVSFTMTCGKSVTTSITTYRGDSYESVRTRIYDGKTTTTHIKSRRIGTCP